MNRFSRNLVLLTELYGILRNGGLRRDVEALRNGGLTREIGALRNYWQISNCVKGWSL